MKILSPKPKQETLEEAATKEGLYRASQNNLNQASAGYNAKWFKRGAVFGAKWMEERMFTEKKVLELMSLSFEAGFKKSDVVKAGLESKETEQEIKCILLKNKMI